MLDEIINYVQSLQNQVEVLLSFKVVISSKNICKYSLICVLFHVDSVSLDETYCSKLVLWLQLRDRCCWFHAGNKTYKYLLIISTKIWLVADAEMGPICFDRMHFSPLAYGYTFLTIYMRSHHISFTNLGFLMIPQFFCSLKVIFYCDVFKDTKD